MKLRPYQIDAVESTLKAWELVPSVLGVAATGMGKTVIAAHIIKERAQYGRVMVVAHREELIFQAARTIKQVTGIEPDIEMADLRASEHSLHGRSPIVISTIQTQNAGKGDGRMTRFNPDDFSLLWIDEAHHAVSRSYRAVIDYYRQNPNLKVLGVTATPDRTDEKALGRVFDEVAFEADIRFGVDDGWLVPIHQTLVTVEGLDLSACRTTAGDLNGADLAKVLEQERNMHEIAGPTIELARGRQTLVFTASLAQAERLTEIFNRHQADCARWVHGGTPRHERRKMLADYALKKFHILVNVGVATEGFDCPGVEVVVMARPTKSRSLYTQMLGRGTRPLAGVVDGDHMHGFAVMRRQAIIESAKPHVEVLDFVGNAGRHRLICSADILGGNMDDEVVEKAKKKTLDEPNRDIREVLAEAENEIAEAKIKAEAERRKKLIASAKYRTTIVSPFDAFGMRPWRERGWNAGKPLSEKMQAMLEKQGINTKGLTYTEAKQLIGEITRRWDSGQCSYKQAKILASRGLPTNVSREQASQMIDQVASQEGWKRPAPRKAEMAGRY